MESFCVYKNCVYVEDEESSSLGNKFCFAETYYGELVKEVENPDVNLVAALCKSALTMTQLEDLIKILQEAY